MFLAISSKAKNRRIMQEIILEGFEERCERIAQKSNALKMKLQNGGKEAIVNIMTEKR